jgi:N-acetylglucosamine kinase-like BadF-type ATPase
VTGSPPLVVGVDVGGTSSRALLARGEEVLASAAGPTASISASGAETARGSLQALLRELVAGSDGTAVDAVCLGTAGSGSADMEALLRSAVAEVLGDPAITVVNDAELVLPAAGLDDGVAVVSGTGVKAVGRLGGRRAAAGGWGYLLGDEGSGYWLVREAVRRVLRRDDAGEDGGPLGAAVLAAAGCREPAGLIDRFHADPAPGGWAAHVPEVLGAPDPAVDEIVRAAGEHLAGWAVEVLRQLDAPPETPVVLAGGVLTGSAAVAGAVRGALVAARPAAPVRVLDGPPVEGALRLAVRAASAA